MADEVAIELRDKTLWLTINREEKRNSISNGVLEGLSRGLDAASEDSNIRSVLITGAGSKAFCAGGDLQSKNPYGTDYSSPYAAAALLFRKSKQVTVPIVGRVNGACLAGGMGLLAMCDLVVAAPHATFGLPEVKVGVFPVQVLSLLQHQLARRVLNEMCLLGDSMSADAALRVGLVNVVAESLDEAVENMLGRLHECSPAALRRGLYTLKKMEDMTFDQAISFAESQVQLFALTDDAREGQAAFREKRKPVWSEK